MNRGSMWLMALWGGVGVHSRQMEVVHKLPVQCQAGVQEQRQQRGGWGKKETAVLQAFF